MAPTPSDAELVRETIARLERVTSDLDAHIKRRAREVAADAIERASRRAEGQMRQAAADLEYQRALAAELRERLLAVPDESVIRADERDRCAFRLRSVFPADFLTRHGLHTRAGARSILAAAAAEIEGKPDGT